MPDDAINPLVSQACDAVATAASAINKATDGKVAFVIVAVDEAFHVAVSGIGIDRDESGKVLIEVTARHMREHGSPDG